jgi:hypothetical protein
VSWRQTRNLDITCGSQQTWRTIRMRTPTQQQLLNRPSRVFYRPMKLEIFDDGGEPDRQHDNESKTKQLTVINNRKLTKCSTLPCILKLTSPPPTHISTLLYYIIKNPKFPLNFLNHHHTEQPNKSQNKNHDDKNLKLRRSRTSNTR